MPDELTREELIEILREEVVLEYKPMSYSEHRDLNAGETADALLEQLVITRRRPPGEPIYFSHSTAWHVIRARTEGTVTAACGHTAGTVRRLVSFASVRPVGGRICGKCALASVPS